MNKAMGMQLLVFGVAVIGLSCLVFVLAKPLATTTLIAGLTGGALCLIAGIRAQLGITQKSLPLLTLIPLTIVLVSQTVMTWGAATPEIPNRGIATATVCLLTLLSYGMLMRVAYAGLSPLGHAAPPRPATNVSEARADGPHRPTVQTATEKS